MKITSVLRTIIICLDLKVVSRILRSIQSFLVDSVFPITSIKKGINTFIHPSVNFKSPENITLGNNVRLQPHVFLWASPHSKITIGDFSGVGPGTKFFSSNHNYEFGKIYIEQAWNERDIVVGNNVWIGAECIITAGVMIGEGSVIGAGSIVTRDVPPYSLALGQPARIIKQKT